MAQINPCCIPETTHRNLPIEYTKIQRAGFALSYVIGTCIPILIANELTDTELFRRINNNPDLTVSIAGMKLNQDNYHQIVRTIGLDDFGKMIDLVSHQAETNLHLGKAILKVQSYIN